MADRPSFLDRHELRLLLFGGKGGVGKTTCALAAALRLAINSPACSYIIVSTDPAHSLVDTLAGDHVPANLEVIEIDPAAALARFKERHASHLQLIVSRGTLLGDDDIARLLDLSMPGLDELMAFLEIADRVEAGRHACIVVDTAPLGHTLRFLGLFRVIDTWLDALDAMLGKHRYLAGLYAGTYEPDDADRFLRETSAAVERLGSLLRDAGRCQFVPVLLAERLSVFQTARLVRELQALEIPSGEMVVNRLVPDGECPHCRQRRRDQSKHLARIADEFRGRPLWGVPVQRAELRGIAPLAGLWDHAGPPDSKLDAVPIVEPLPVRVDSPLPIPGPGVRCLLFAGKGGTGKTTLACATALRLAEERPGRQLLLFSTDPAHSLEACLGVTVGPVPVRVCPGLSAVEIDAEAEFAALRKEYADEISGFFDGMLGGGIAVGYDRDVFERLLDLSPPGIDEVMALTRVIDLLDEGDYDDLVMDTAPTGHLLRLLELPGLVQDWLRVIFGLLLKYKGVIRVPRVNDLLVALSKGVKRLRAMLTDPDRGQLVAVSILTPLSLAKTHDLVTGCAKVGVRVVGLMLNQATPAAAAEGCPLCAASAATEAVVERRFAEELPGLSRSVIDRATPFLGLDRLRLLGAALYRPSPDQPGGHVSGDV